MAEAGLFREAGQLSEKVGKIPIRETLMIEDIEQKTRFKTGWLLWSELGMGVTRPDLLVKIRLGV